MEERLRDMRRCHPDYVKVSRISGIIGGVTLMTAAAAYLLLAQSKGWTLIPGWAALALFIIAFIWFTCIEPGLTYRTFGFKVSPEQLELASGYIWLSDTVVPMTRVQHVELESGPLLRRYGLAEVKVVTAAKTHVIKALEKTEAEQLKFRIGELAKVVDHDE
ncbi:PH domain-containing protein [Paenibacillus lemnae]|uniref:PH domain-containing protein n=1 Tax=Paenibacillus lemnae TaxID=1330551 RepID=A0A848M2Y7_PAELE|nr:PH domain-containing protein [Paenibacillus lemnae]